LAVKHYVDEIPPQSGRVYQIVTNGTTSTITDVTVYQQEGAGFGSSDVNAACVLECNYAKSGTVHQLTTQNSTSENIKFFATAAYNRGDTFTFNGTAVEAKTVDGAALDTNFFKANTLVVCLLKESVLYFPSQSKALVDDNDATNVFRIGLADGMLYVEDD
jgi:hypothetical protein